MKTKYVIRTRIAKIFEKEVNGTPFINTERQWEIPKNSLGWAIMLEGSYECLLIGAEKPDLQVGQQMKIIIEAE